MFKRERESRAGRNDAANGNIIFLISEKRIFDNLIR